MIAPTSSVTTPTMTTAVEASSVVSKTKLDLTTR
jgi:hypothetical protein